MGESIYTKIISNLNSLSQSLMDCDLLLKLKYNKEQGFLKF